VPGCGHDQYDDVDWQQAGVIEQTPGNWGEDNLSAGPQTPPSSGTVLPAGQPSAGEVAVLDYARPLWDEIFRPLGSEQGDWTWVSLRAMELGDILDRSFHIVKRSFRTILAVTAVGYGLFYLANAAFTMSTTGGASSGSRIGLTILAGLIMFLSYPLIFWSGGALTILSARTFLNRDITFSLIWRLAWQRFWPLLGSSLLAGLVILGILVPFIISIALVAVSPWFLILAIPMGLLGIGGAFVCTIRFSLIFEAVALENQGAVDGLRRSWYLTRAYLGKVFVVFLVVGLITWVATVPFTIMFAMLSYLSPALAQTAIGLVNIMVVYLPQIAGVVLYFDLRIRKEGFDLELMADLVSRETMIGSVTQ